MEGEGIGMPLFEIRKVRLEKDLMIEEVAKATGLSSSYISAIEMGKKMPSLPTAFKLADFYGLTVDQLFRDIVEYKAGKQRRNG